MAKLPVTVTDFYSVGSGLYAVTVAYADLTTGTFLIPQTLATVEAVRFSVLALAVLSDPDVTKTAGPHHKNRRWAPRP